ncbi:ABC transporter ATP-binding protein [Microbulbifer sp. TYP-18]|uniref:ABC transporter ATP-binding protein n=1 Tax=Microbulbifer sp. TYP-18 TaxID=3230024 RepID=UPI0034C5F229
MEFRGVVKRYGDNPPVLPGLNLRVDDGEFMVLVGPSGCGKSTTLRLIAGLESVTAGELWIGSRLVNLLPPKDRDVAMVFQNYALYPHMTVFENMAFGLRVRRQPQAQVRSKVQQVAESLGLTDLLLRKPGQLSGGQCQRVALGRAIVRDPQVFLFDEPLSNLDAELRVQMRANIGGLHRDLGTTSVYVTHDQVEAMTLGSRIAILNAGAVMQVGTPMELYGEPDNVFVAAFMGSPPMNIVPVQNRGDSLGNGLFTLGREDVAGLGGELLLGVRPEKICHGAEAPRHWPRMRAAVAMVETLGAEMLVHVGDGAERMIARLPGLRPLTPGMVLELALNPDSVYLFDSQSQCRIRPAHTRPEPVLCP